MAGPRPLMSDQVGHRTWAAVVETEIGATGAGSGGEVRDQALNGCTPGGVASSQVANPV